MAAPAITVPGTVSRHWKTGHVSALPARPGSPRRGDDSEEITAQQVNDRVQVLAIDVEHGPLCGAGDARTTAVRSPPTSRRPTTGYS